MKRLFLSAFLSTLIISSFILVLLFKYIICMPCKPHEYWLAGHIFLHVKKATLHNSVAKPINLRGDLQGYC